MQTGTIKRNLPVIVLATGITLYCLTFLILTFWKLGHFYYDNLDLAIFNQVFFNILNGDLFRATIHPPTYLGDHFSPFIFLLIPFYALAPGPEALLTLETLIIGLTAIPIYLIAKHILGSSRQWLSVGIASLWLLNPTVHNMNFFEFALIPFAAFFLLWAIYFYLKEKKLGFILMLILALIVREDVALIIIFFSLLAWVDKRPLFWKLFPIAASGIYSAISFPIISYFTATGSYKFLGYYGWLGGTSVPSIIISFLAHPIQVISHQLTFKNLEFVLGLTFPFFFLAFTRSKYILLLLAPLGQVWLSTQGGSALILMTHYVGFFLFALFVIFITRIRKIEDGVWPRLIPKSLRNKSSLYFIIFSATVYASLTYGSVVPALSAWTEANQKDAKAELVWIVPDDVPVAATFELLTPLSTRSSIYAFHYAVVGKNQFALTDYSLPPDTEYLAIDWQDILKMQFHFDEHHAFGPYAASVSKRIRATLSEFELIYANGSIALWKKSDQANGDLPALAHLEKNEGIMPSESNPAIKTTMRNKTATEIHIALPKKPSHNNYFLEIITDIRTFSIPIGYGLFMPTEWSDNTLLSMQIFIGQNEKISSLSIYGWNKSFLELGPLKNLGVVSDAEALGEPFTL